MVVALAGRRIDAPGAQPSRFPPESVSAVAARIEAELEKTGASTLVCSAACGADLIALRIAGELGLRRRIILPFGREDFRRTSVTDRPGEWGALFDRVMDEAGDDVVTLGLAPDEDSTYTKANVSILDAARTCADDAGKRLIAMIVWDRESRGESDVTGHFMTEARHRGLPVVEIDTLR